MECTYTSIYIHIQTDPYVYMQHIRSRHHGFTCTRFYSSVYLYYLNAQKKPTHMHERLCMAILLVKRAGIVYFRGITVNAYAKTFTCVYLTYYKGYTYAIQTIYASSALDTLRGYVSQSLAITTLAYYYLLGYR